MSPGVGLTQACPFSYSSYPMYTAASCGLKALTLRAFAAEIALDNDEHAFAQIAAGSLKWDTYGGRDVIPLWVADMDLKTSPAIVDAVKERVDHGIFGYSFPTEGVKTAVMNYYKASGHNFLFTSSSLIACWILFLLFWGGV